jgi:hypothetical protein
MDQTIVTWELPKWAADLILRTLQNLRRSPTCRVNSQQISRALEVLRIDDTTHHQLEAVARAYQAALQMSDSAHPDFRDSCADVVEFLWQHKAQVDAVLAKVPPAPTTPTSAPATARTITNQ